MFSFYFFFCASQTGEQEEEMTDVSKPNQTKDEERKEYNLAVLKHVQAIFGHLACSKLQYYVPRGFWKHFKWVLFCVFYTRIRSASLKVMVMVLSFTNVLGTGKICKFAVPLESLSDAVSDVGFTLIMQDLGPKRLKNVAVWGYSLKMSSEHLCN